MHATQLLAKFPAEVPPIVVVWGSQRLLKQRVLGEIRRRLTEGDDEVNETRHAGRDATWQAVIDDTSQISMWGGKRLVLVEEAEEFVTNHRAQLEKLLTRPPTAGVLVLDVKTWAKTTRLAKGLPAVGLEAECTDLKGADLIRWLNASAPEMTGKKLASGTAALLVDLVGDDLGLLEQEISKLGSSIGDRMEITPADVRALVVNWQTETTWAMNDAVRDGHLGPALKYLADLLHAGEAPQKLLGGIGFTFRRIAYAVELARSQPLEQALRDAGIYPQAVSPSVSYLRRIGRPRAERILPALLTADANLKGSSKLPEQLILEQLLIELSGPAVRPN